MFSYTMGVLNQTQRLAKSKILSFFSHGEWITEENTKYV